jgi:glycosyltransferase involved in cell wall biosynthesis
MKILQVQRFFYLRGGSSRYFFEVSKLLKKYGHNVGFFSMDHQRNKKSIWSKFFVSNVSFRDISLIGRFRYLERMFIGLEAMRKISRVLDYFKPDIVHLHDIYHHIPPTIIWEIKRRGIPIVQTIGDYHLIAPNYFMFHQGEICEATSERKYHQAIFHRCVKQSFAVSLAEIAEKYFHRILKFDEQSFDKIITPSSFVKKKLVEAGISQHKIISIPYLPRFHKATTVKLTSAAGKYVLYFGRLSEEKGIETLIKGIGCLPKIKLKIAGEGPQREYLEKIVTSMHLKNVEFIGFLEQNQLTRTISNCKFTVLPSMWNEAFGLSIVESFWHGKPVIGSRIGAIPELIISGKNGLLFEPGNFKDCAGKIDQLWNDQKLYRKLGLQAQRDSVKFYDTEKHYAKLMAVYRQAIKSFSE